jgi:hypothetical protein
MGLHEVDPNMLQTPIKPMAKGFTVCKNNEFLKIFSDYTYQIWQEKIKNKLSILKNVMPTPVSIKFLKWTFIFQNTYPSQRNYYEL